MEQIRRIMRPTDVPDTGTVGAGVYVDDMLVLNPEQIHFLWICPRIYVWKKKKNAHEELLHLLVCIFLTCF